MPQHKLGVADDFTDADGVKVLDYEQATKAAGEWFKERARRAHLRDTGEVISDAPYTVKQALEAMIEDAEQRGRPMGTVKSYARSRIIPELGEIEIGNLTRERIKRWHLELSKSRRLRTGQKTPGRELTEAEEKDAAPLTEEQKKSRRATANRILAILKRALSIAVEEKRYSGASVWRDVKPFRDATTPRTRFLSPEEQVRLVNACSPDFRLLVVAALHTGSRYGPLTRMRAKDFNPSAGTVFIEKDKGGRSRHIVLDAEAIEWFGAQVAGKGPDDLLLTRHGVKRVTRKDTPERWMQSDQRPFMLDACKVAKLDPLTFHELRHTYASMLINAGVPLAFVADQLGHVNTRMVEKYYGHLCHTAKAEAIRKLIPSRGFEIPNVSSLTIKKA